MYFCPAIVKLKSKTTANISKSHMANCEKSETICSTKLNLRTSTSQRCGQLQVGIIGGHRTATRQAFLMFLVPLFTQFHTVKTLDLDFRSPHFFLKPALSSLPKFCTLIVVAFVLTLSIHCKEL